MFHLSLCSLFIPSEANANQVLPRNGAQQHPVHCDRARADPLRVSEPAQYTVTSNASSSPAKASSSPAKASSSPVKAPSTVPQAAQCLTSPSRVGGQQKMDSPAKGKRRSKAQHKVEKTGVADNNVDYSILQELSEFLKPLPACISPIMDMVTI